MNSNHAQLQDEDCEKIVLGTIMAERDAIHKVSQILHEDCFYKPFHKAIYKAVTHLVAEAKRPDPITVKARLEAMGEKFHPVELLQATDKVTFDLYQHAARLSDLSVRRKFYEIGQYLISNSITEAEDIVDVTAQANDRLASLFRSDTSGVATMKDALETLYEQVNKNMSQGCGLTGTPTGFERIDERMGGLQKSNLIIIAAETSQGKTSLATSIANNATQSGAKVAFYSMEMKKEEMAARLVAIQSGVPANVLLYSPLTPSQFQHVDKGIGQLVGRTMYFDDRSTSSLETILSSIRYMKLKYGIDGVVVDYLQILNINTKASNKEQQMGEAARRLKNIAKELDIWVIALSQLSRDQANHVPSLSRLRDSGQIAEAADVVMLIYRPEVYNANYPEEFREVSTHNTAMIDIAKGRNVGLMKFICGFSPPTTHFYDLSEVPIKQPNAEDDDEEMPF